MTPILGIMASAISGNLTPTTGFVSIATSTVGAGGSAAITFSGIPQVYKHLQIRGILRGSATTTSNDQMRIRFNDDSSSNYAYHMMLGSGSAVSASSTTTQTEIIGMQIVGSASTANVFGASVTEILDYTSTTKNKTVRILDGQDTNGAGYVVFQSGLWYKTPEAITKISIYYPDGSTSGIGQYSSFALYGIQGA
jgi:hypothetical protein